MGSLEVTGPLELAASPASGADLNAAVVGPRGQLGHPGMWLRVQGWPCARVAGSRCPVGPRGSARASYWVDGRVWAPAAGGRRLHLPSGPGWTRARMLQLSRRATRRRCGKAWHESRVAVGSCTDSLPLGRCDLGKPRRRSNLGRIVAVLRWEFC